MTNYRKTRKNTATRKNRKLEGGKRKASRKAQRKSRKAERKSRKAQRKH